MEKSLVVRVALYAVCFSVSAVILSVQPSDAQACSYLTGVDLVWPSPLSSSVGTNAQIWVQGTRFGDSSEPRAELVDPLGDVIPLVAQSYPSGTSIGAELAAFRPAQPLTPNTLYTVRAKVPYASQGVGFVTDVEGLQSSTENGEIVLEWSFETGPDVVMGISNDVLEGVTWGRGFTVDVEESSCFDTGVGSTVAYYDPLQNSSPGSFGVMYRLEGTNAEGEQVGLAQYAYMTLPGMDEARRSLMHITREWEEDLCIRLSAIDSYGHVVETELLCTPDACAEVDDEQSLFADEEALLATGTDACDGPDVVQEPNPNPTPPASETPATPETDGQTSGPVTDTPNAEDDDALGDSGCTQVAVSSPKRTPVFWGLVLLGALVTLRRKIRA